MEGQVPQKNRLQLDDVFQWVRSFGSYQKILYIVGNLLLTPISLQFALLVFGTGTPKFHCSSPNSTCPSGKCCDNCTSYTFDGPFTSAVSEWNLICDRAHIGATVQSCFFIGMLLGSIPGGWLSDTFGRRICIIVGLSMMFVSSIGTYFADCPSLLALLRLFVGFFLVSLMLCQYVYIIEIVGPRRRTFSGKIQDFFWDFGDVISFLLAYLIRDWRMLTLISTLIIIPFILCWRFVPETVRWLVANNRLDEACNQLMKYGGRKKQKLNRDELMNLLEEVQENEKMEKERRGKRKLSPLDLFKTPKIRKRSFILGFNWFVISMVYFGFYLYITALSGNIYFNFLIMGLLTIPNLPISYFLMEKFGRRIPFIGYMFLSALLCLSVLVIPGDNKTAVLAIAIIGRVLNSCCFNNVYLYTSELYPTVIRNVGIGFGSTCARIGAILSPYIVMLSQLPGLNVTLPVTVFGICGLFASLLSLWLPETLNATMSQTVEEAEIEKETFALPCRIARSRHAQQVEMEKTPETSEEKELMKDDERI
ncbi:organic cation transporter protein-like [Actinia tenebrosa]|uniref:Organic cation transporter protein-like n=1 Tax=Actinia tenebrosa TaxID=6105 RepID=A0A6P8I0E7_ACTTE|nr:organic cation transporter protein-like [Actinia tenebrosa]